MLLADTAPEDADVVLRRTCWAEVPAVEPEAAEEELRTVVPLAEEVPEADPVVVRVAEPEELFRVWLPVVVDRVWLLVLPVVVDRVWLPVLPEAAVPVFVLRRTWGSDAAEEDALREEAAADVLRVAAEDFVAEALLFLVAEVLEERVTCRASEAPREEVAVDVLRF